MRRSTFFIDTIIIGICAWMGSEYSTVALVGGLWGVAIGTGIALILNPK